MGFCFMEIKKITSTGKMNSTYKHNYREVEVANAIKELSNMNEELVQLPLKENGERMTYSEAFEKKFQSLDYYKNHKLRGDAVLAYEIVTTFSSEDKNRVDIDKWKEDNVRWLRETFNKDKDKYGDNVLSVVFHGDECGNVHCHAFIVPVDERGHICATSFTNGPTAMRKLQDSYAKYMEAHNLERGIKGSTARHQDIKKFYTKLNQTMEVPMPEIGEPATAFRERILEMIQEERAAALREYMQKETRLQQEADRTRNSAMNAAMNIANAEMAEKQGDIYELDKKIAAKKKEISGLEKEYFDTDKARNDAQMEVFKLEEEGEKLAQKIQQLGNVKEIMSDYRRRENVMEYTRQEMPEFADKMEQDYQLAEQLYDSREREQEAVH